MWVIAERILYMHGSASAHFSRAVRDVINNTYHDQWRRRQGPVAWPPRSPHLNPLDFYPWGHVKSLVYASSVAKKEAIHRRIVDACQTILNYLGIFERMRRSRMRRVEACLESHEDILGTYYKCTLSAVTCKLYVSGHLPIWIFSLFRCRTSVTEMFCHLCWTRTLIENSLKRQTMSKHAAD
jgi:hypothetical protein